jgi:hypothetical protein
MTRQSPVLATLGALLVLGDPVLALAQPARVLRVRYAFQPDCYRSSLAAACDPRKTDTRLELGPQIAVWVESADGTRFIDTLLVTNATAYRGIGNRPGHWSMPSSLKFPYGKRPMALPIWAHRRGRAYDALVMQDGVERELWLGFHEAISSPDPYFCRPTNLSDLDVDALSCPTPVFNSAKGAFSATQPKVYYPPRNDLRSFVAQDCDDRSARLDICPVSARGFAELNDLDAVAAATPAYGKSFSGSWVVPNELPDGEYALWLEISKEFDNNEAHAHPAHTDPMLANSGVKNNLGQPSVVFRVRFPLSRRARAGFQDAVTEMAGYGDWDGATGTLHAPDSTISDGPGTGQGRLLAIPWQTLDGGEQVGRLHVITEVPPVAEGPDGGAAAVDATAVSVEAGGPAPDPVAVDAAAGGACLHLRAEVAGLRVDPEAEAATVRFNEPSDGAFDLVERYLMRVWEGEETSEAAFRAGTPAETLAPEGRGQARALRIADLKSERRYTVGVKPEGICVEGSLATFSFVTAKRSFSTLSGCFIATAAFGSAQAHGVAALRRVRDRARAANGFAAAAAALYERSSPPLADLLRTTETGRALVRETLGPLVDVVEALETP